MELSSGQLGALRNLARKQTGADVGFINIGDAQALTELGLAERDRGGWRITTLGAAELAAHGPDAPPPTTTGATPLRRST